MALPYEFFDHTADIGVRVYGATLSELLTNAARAMYAAMGEFHRTKDSRQKSVTLKAGTLEDLLHDWLSELLFEFSAHQTLYNEWEFAQLDAAHLTATMRGGLVDFPRSRPRAEIKAVTYHQLHVEQVLDGTWRATVIFDV